MQDSVVISPKGTPYKDIFTLPLQKFIYKDSIIEVTLDSKDISRPDYLGSKIYTEDEFEDFVLWLNVVGLLQYKNPGDTLEAPSKVDLEDFYFKYRV